MATQTWQVAFANIRQTVQRTMQEMAIVDSLLNIPYCKAWQRLAYRSLRELCADVGKRPLDYVESGGTKCDRAIAHGSDFEEIRYRGSNKMHSLTSVWYACADLNIDQYPKVCRTPCVESQKLPILWSESVFPTVLRLRKNRERLDWFYPSALSLPFAYADNSEVPSFSSCELKR